MKKVISILTTMLLLCFPAYSQDESLTDSQTEQKSKQIEIYFDLNSCIVDPAYHRNSESLSNLVNLISQLQQDSLTTISKIEISSYASPDGGKQYNETITEQRTNAIIDYLRGAISVPDSAIIKNNIGIDWAGLQQLVEASTTMEYKDEVLHILNTVPEEIWSRVNPSDRWLTMTDSLNHQLMDLKRGKPYRYMINEFFPQLRRSSIATIYICKEVEEEIEEEIEAIEPQDTIQLLQEQAIEDVAPIPTYTEQIEVAKIAEELIISESESKSSLFALKTNLLYDAATIINVEAEIPIGDRWSVAGEWIFPWWTTSDNAYALQMLSGQLEGKYWFGDRTNKPQLTGWFAGLYAGGGLYDLQWDSNGYQGEFYIAAGLSAGYAHTINKSGSLRMEYSVGVGYLSTDYRYYEGMEDNQFLVWQHDGTYTWIGPTKAKVSLVWMLGKKGGKR